MKIRAVLWTILGLVISGCVAIPSDSGVHLVEDDAGFGESTARYLPAGPVAGASRSDIARAFLDAMLAYPVTYKVAAEFLTPDAARAWQHDVQTTMYSAARVRASGDGAKVWIDVDVEARLDLQGRMTQMRETQRIDTPMEKVDGEWRISEPPRGILMSRGFADDYLRPFDLYFLDQSGSRVVPEPVHAVVGDQLATALMAALAWGPDGPSARAQRTAVPAASVLRSSVPIVKDVAQIAFGTKMARLEETTREQLSAQIVWTLRQVPGVSRVRISGSDGVLVEPDVADQPLDMWSRFGPPQTGRFAHVLANGRVSRVDADRSRAAPGRWGADAKGAQMVAMGRSRAAAVWRDRARVTNVDGGEAIEVEGATFLRPVVDATGSAWLVDSGNGQSRARVVDAGGVAVMEPPGWSRHTWRSFAVSPDGARWAATDLNGAVFVGAIDRRAKQVHSLGAPVRVDLSGERARTVQWLSSSSLVFLSTGARGHMGQVRVDGSGFQAAWPNASARLPAGEIVDLVVTPTEDPEVFVLDSTEHLWILEGSQWRKLGINNVRGIA